MIKYLGSKRRLVPALVELVESFGDCETVLDLFSGTSRVSFALKREGYAVTANDSLAVAATLARAHVQADDDRAAEAEALLEELARLPGRPGYFTETFCRASRFVRPENGARIDAVREAIAARDLDPELRAIALTALVEAADRVDSTTGVQMAYVKEWAPRSLRPLELRLPKLLPRGRRGPSRALEGDAAGAAAAVEADVAYLDPPYNQHAYLGNYHVWETLVRWDAPATYGVACKRVDCRTRKSPFNRRREALPALERLLDAVRCRWLVVSFNDEGFVSREELVELLAPRGALHVLARPQARYVGARIGIHGPNGRKVGTVGRLANLEYVFVVAPHGAEWTPPAGLDLLPVDAFAAGSAAGSAAVSAPVA